MNEPSRQVASRTGNSGDFTGMWSMGDLVSLEEHRAVDLRAGLGNLVSLGFIVAALKRRARLWCLTGALGLLIGCGLYVALPPSYKATATLLMNNGPNGDPLGAMEADAALAVSNAAAQNTVQKLGLQQSPTSFSAASTATVVNDDILTISVNAPSSSEAVQRTNALAAIFLQLKASIVQKQLQELAVQLNQEVSQAQATVNSVTTQINQVSPADTTRLNGLKTQLTNANGTLTQVKLYAVGTLASTQSSTNEMIKDSEVLDAAAPQKQSRLKSALLYVGGGLIVGLALGVGFVAVSEIVSDRLRRRVDVADALGAAVGLSVGSLKAARGPLGSRNTAARDADMNRVIGYLRRAVSTSSSRPARLAVVAVDNAEIVAPLLITLAKAYAENGWRVVVADMSGSATMGKLLGVTRPGVHELGAHGAQFTVVVPNSFDFAPLGPFGDGASRAERTEANEMLFNACRQADLVLSLAVLDPAVGAEHLATWAATVVAVVTAGHSTAVRLRAVGEMIRVTGVRFTSAVLIDADKSDESLGLVTGLDLPVRTDHA